MLSMASGLRWGCGTTSTAVWGPPKARMVTSCYTALHDTKDSAPQLPTLLPALTAAGHATAHTGGTPHMCTYTYICIHMHHLKADNTVV